jgi:sugar O-acyltransferase (sialic acid O-acetyltransferase NeuD family)
MVETTAVHPLVIIGAGGHGRETLDIVQAINQQQQHAAWNFLGFLADGEIRPDLSFQRGAKILGGVSHLQNLDCFFVIGIGSGHARREIDAVATSIGRQSAILVHPKTILGSEISMEPGCIVAGGAIISTNVKMGKHTHIDIGASISHDVSIGNYCTICPGVRVAGWVQIADGATIGVGAVLKDRVKIGSNAMIGAGSVVIGDVPPDVTVAGVPARPLHDSQK